MNYKTNLANRKNYGAKRSLDDIEFIVIHYTANDGDTDEGNGNYFKNNAVQVSAHYFVDDDSVTQSVPDDYIAWHCGAKKYLHKKCRNANSIGVEICDDVKNGVVYPSAKTIDNVLELVRSLMKKYNVPKENVIRHYDVSGKLCPMYWAGSAEKDKLWRSEFWDKLGGETVKAPVATVAELYRVRTAWENAKTQKGAYKNLDGAKQTAKAYKGYKVFNSAGVCVYDPWAKKSITEVAREVIAGKWGVGAKRKAKLAAAGYDYAAVQAKVNDLLR